MHMKANATVAGPKVVPVHYHLEDPESLGQTESDIELKGAVGENLLELALDHGINIEHACGGVCACSTCHVYLEKGEDIVSEPDDDELDRVDEAPDVRLNSRLSCQTVIQEEDGEIHVTVPAWNRNAVKEVPH